MRLRILGAAAGGGFPQWNCNCPGCQAVRANRPGICARTQSSLAVRATSKTPATVEPWYLVNASPDIRQQLERLRDRPSATSPSAAVRSSPIAGVLLTDAEIDHTAGLMLLRESTAPLAIYCTDTVRQALNGGWPLLRVLQEYCTVAWSPLVPGSPFALGDEATGLEVEAFRLPAKPPRYARSEFSGAGDWVTGLTFRDRASGGVLTYAPALAELAAPVLARLAASDCILVDGTCWQDDDLVALGTSTRTARSMGHLPLAGDDGSLAQLAKLPCARKILIHINNTNPILRADSVARQQVEAAGLEVGYDGLEIDL